MTIGEVVQEYPNILSIFFDFGLHCVGCPSASSETVEQACESHVINLKDFLIALNKAI